MRQRLIALHPLRKFQPDSLYQILTGMPIELKAVNVTANKRVIAFHKRFPRLAVSKVSYRNQLQWIGRLAGT
jgi:hypothetical protein